MERDDCVFRTTYTSRIEGNPIDSPLKITHFWDGHCASCKACEARGPWRIAFRSNHLNKCPVRHIMAILHFGFLPPYKSEPPKFHFQNSSSLDRAPVKTAQELEKMRKEGVLVPTAHSDHVSPLGAVIKPSDVDDTLQQLIELGGDPSQLDLHDIDALNAFIEEEYGGAIDAIPVRVVFDLSRAHNDHLMDWDFTFVDLEAVIDVIIGGGPFLFKWDYRRCFHSIVVHPLARKYVACEISGQHYEAWRVIFGTKVGPAVACMLTGFSRDIMRHATALPRPDIEGRILLRKVGPPRSISTYVDDNMGGAKTKEEADIELKDAAATVEALGWSLPEDHIDLPACEQTFRGTLFDTRRRLMRTPVPKLRRTLRKIVRLRQSGAMVKDVRSLTGSLNWLSNTQEEGRIHTHGLYAENRPWARPTQHIGHLSQAAQAELGWWEERIERGIDGDMTLWTTYWTNSQPMRYRVYSDAAGDHGFGAIVVPPVGAATAVIGCWSAVGRPQSSTWKELVPIYLALLQIAPSCVPGQLVILTTDSQAAAFQINKQYTSAESFPIVAAIITVAAKYKIHVVADWAPRDTISLLDALSKLELIVPKAGWPVA
jgi:hypothetical protein